MQTLVLDFDRAEVYQLQTAIVRQDHVIWLDVPVYEAVFVEFTNDDQYCGEEPFGFKTVQFPSLE